MSILYDGTFLQHRILIRELFRVNSRPRTFGRLFSIFTHSQHSSTIAPTWYVASHLKSRRSVHSIAQTKLADASYWDDWDTSFDRLRVARRVFQQKVRRMQFLLLATMDAVLCFQRAQQSRVVLPTFNRRLWGKRRSSAHGIHPHFHRS